MELLLANKLKIARKMRGLSMEALSQKMGGLVTKQAISKYETGKMQPSEEVLQALAGALNLPVTYFYKQSVAIGTINFRIDARLPAKSASRMVSIAQDKIEHYLDIEELLNISSVVNNPIRGMKIHSMRDVEAAAQKLRSAWNLGDLPISSVYDMLENQGVKIIEFPADVSSVLGFSSYVNNTIPLIVINLSANQTTERKRFTVIHELGHLFLQFTEEIDEAMRERFCHLFAGAVLCPAHVFCKELGESRKVIALDELVSLRRRYGISIAASVHRAKDLGIISDAYYNNIFNRYIHANKMEEGWGCYPIDEHTDRFNRLLHRCIAEGYMSMKEASYYVNEKPHDYKWKITLLV